MNIFNYNTCETDCNTDHSIDPNTLPANFDINKIFEPPCMNDCRKPACKDIQEGFYEFSGPATVRSLCGSGLKCGVIDDGSFNKNDYIKHSFAIRKMKGDEPNPATDRIVGAVWRETEGTSSEFTVKCQGDYYVHYKWDNCFECEPLFEDETICCDPCS